MKVCVIHNEYGAHSGEETIVDAMRDLLESHDHDVIPYTRSSAEIPRMRFGKIRALLSGIYNPLSKTRIRHILGKERPDIVHVHNVFPFISPAVLSECRRAGVPVVMTVHNYRLVCPSGLHMMDGRVCEKCCGGKEYYCLWNNCEASIPKSLGYFLRNYVARKWRFFLDNVTVYACLTEFQRKRLIAEGFPPERLVVIPNMANTFADEVEEDQGRGYVGFVGRVSREKGVATLVEAARQNTDITFKAAGACDRMPELLATAPANFTFLGAVPRTKIGGFYRSSRCIVLCSTCFEGFPMAIVEAMMHGKAVIASRIGGIPEIVEEGVTGLLFEPGNAQDLAEKIRLLWNHPERCRRMGLAGREKAKQEYSPEKYYQRLMNVYEKALAFGPGGNKVNHSSYRRTVVPLSLRDRERSRTPEQERITLRQKHVG